MLGKLYNHTCKNLEIMDQFLKTTLPKLTQGEII